MSQSLLVISITIHVMILAFECATVDKRMKYIVYLEVFGGYVTILVKFPIMNITFEKHKGFAV